MVEMASSPLAMGSDRACLCLWTSRPWRDIRSGPSGLPVGGRHSPSPPSAVLHFGPSQHVGVDVAHNPPALDDLASRGPLPLHGRSAAASGGSRNIDGHVSLSRLSVSAVCGAHSPRGSPSGRHAIFWELRRSWADDAPTYGAIARALGARPPRPAVRTEAAAAAGVVRHGLLPRRRHVRRDVRRGAEGGALPLAAAAAEGPEADVAEVVAT